MKDHLMIELTSGNSIAILNVHVSFGKLWNGFQGQRAVHSRVFTCRNVYSYSIGCEPNLSLDSNCYDSPQNTSLHGLGGTD